MAKGPNDFSQAAKQQAATAKAGKLPPAAGKVCFATDYLHIYTVLKFQSPHRRHSGLGGDQK